MKITKTGYKNTRSRYTLNELTPPARKKYISSKSNSSQWYGSFGRTIVNMQYNVQEEDSDAIRKLVDTVAENYGYRVYRFLKGNGKTLPYRAKAGDKIPNRSDLFNEKLNISCYTDENKKALLIFVLDKNSKAVDVYDAKGENIKSYSPSDMQALFEYKYRPEQIHNYLRKNRFISNLSEENLWRIIDTLDSCFNTGKMFVAEKPFTVFHALPQGLSDNDKALLTTVGSVYRDNSFISTTKRFDTAKRFSAGSVPLMEISIPAGSKYLDLDKLLNIDLTHWNEQEMLLKRGSEFLITGFDRENNIIKACLFK